MTWQTSTLAIGLLATSASLHACDSTLDCPGEVGTWVLTETQRDGGCDGPELSAAIVTDTIELRQLPDGGLAPPWPPHEWTQPLGQSWLSVLGGCDVTAAYTTGGMSFASDRSYELKLRGDSVTGCLTTQGGNRFDHTNWITTVSNIEGHR